MDQTLVQIINEWLAVQAVAQRLEQENTDLKAQLAELQKPTATVVSVPAKDSA